LGSPKLGQFTSHDPLGYVDTQNLYAFAAFDPINGWDPFGLESQGQAEEADQEKSRLPVVGDFFSDRDSELKREAIEYGLMDAPVVVGPTPEKNQPEGEWLGGGERKMRLKDAPSVEPNWDRHTFLHELDHAIEESRVSRRTSGRATLLTEYVMMMRLLGKNGVGVPSSGVRSSCRRVV
jgi:hypothetical protein